MEGQGYGAVRAGLRGQDRDGNMSLPGVDKVSVTSGMPPLFQHGKLFRYNTRGSPVSPLARPRLGR